MIVQGIEDFERAGGAEGCRENQSVPGQSSGVRTTNTMSTAHLTPRVRGDRASLRVGSRRRPSWSSPNGQAQPHQTRPPNMPARPSMPMVISGQRRSVAKLEMVPTGQAKVGQRAGVAVEGRDADRVQTEQRSDVEGDQRAHLRPHARAQRGDAASDPTACLSDYGPHNRSGYSHVGQGSAPPPGADSALPVAAWLAVLSAPSGARVRLPSAPRRTAWVVASRVMAGSSAGAPSTGCRTASTDHAISPAKSRQPATDQQKPCAPSGNGSVHGQATASETASAAMSAAPRAETVCGPSGTSSSRPSRSDRSRTMQGL